MLTELTLANFRIFSDEVTVRFRPITILIGRNNSGKSSIIKFLLMLQQSGPGYPQFLNPEGDRVHLGPFQALKNSLSTKQNLTFGITMQNDTDTVVRPFSPLLKLPTGFDLTQLLYTVDATVPYRAKSRSGRVSYSMVNPSSGRNLWQIKSKTSGELTLWQQPPPTFNPDVQAELADLQDSDEVSDEQQEYLQKVLSYAADSMVIAVSHHSIASFRHLSPVRDESQRVIVASPPPNDSVGQSGQYTLPHLQNFVSKDREKYEFISPHIQNIAGIDALRFKTSSGYVIQAFAKSRSTGADVLIADYGFGVSQCLPILVQGAIMEPNTTLMVEQPEAQLHPTAQLEMGSYFADLWKKRKVGTILETHSGNVLLRLRRLIAKGELSHEDVSVAYFTTDDDNIPVVKNLDIYENGSLEPGLPMEFFGADVIEGLQMGARE